jgi:hypothetical protein
VADGRARGARLHGRARRRRPADGVPGAPRRPPRWADGGAAVRVRRAARVGSRMRPQPDRHDGPGRGDRPRAGRGRARRIAAGDRYAGRGGRWRQDHPARGGRLRRRRCGPDDPPVPPGSGGDGDARQREVRGGLHGDAGARGDGAIRRSERARRGAPRVRGHRRHAPAGARRRTHARHRLRRRGGAEHHPGARCDDVRGARRRRAAPARVARAPPAGRVPGRRADDGHDRGGRRTRRIRTTRSDATLRSRPRSSGTPGGGAHAHALRPAGGAGSTDMGNVTQVLPGLHGMLAIDDAALPHTAAFATAARSERGDRTLVDGASVLAGIALELFSDPTFLETVQAAFTADARPGPRRPAPARRRRSPARARGPSRRARRRTRPRRPPRAPGRRRRPRPTT